MRQPTPVITPLSVLQDIDLVAMHPLSGDGQNEMVSAARESIAVVFQDFLTVKELSLDRITIIDGFSFLFNDTKFPQWHRLNWWEQRRYIQTIKDYRLYTDRAQVLLEKSCFAPYIGYSDEMVAKSTDQEVKRAWMRKRLVLQECFWNAIDSISHAAYYKKKYDNLIPALTMLLCKVTDKNGDNVELVFGIDNGTGFLYKKKSRDSALVHLIYQTYKFLFRNGVFYIGGLELGLLETDSELSCHGSGAVVYQGWR